MPIASSHSTTLYTLGKGILYIAEFSGGAPGAYSDVGNCPEFNYTPTQEVLKHYSSRTGTKTEDKETIIEVGYTADFILDELSILNLKMFMRGTLTGNKIKANLALDKEYALRFISDNPAGPNIIYQFWRCKLSPNGAFSLIGDEWSTLSFSASGLVDTVNHTASPYYEAWYQTTTSTTTSSSTTTTTV